MTDLEVLATTSRPDIGTQWLPGSIPRTMSDDAPQPRPDFFTPLPRSFAKFTHFIDEHIRIIQVGKALTSASFICQCEREFCSRQPKGSSTAVAVSWCPLSWAVWAVDSAGSRFFLWCESSQYIPHYFLSNFHIYSVAFNYFYYNYACSFKWIVKTLILLNPSPWQRNRSISKRCTTVDDTCDPWRPRSKLGYPLIPYSLNFVYEKPLRGQHAMHYCDATWRVQ